jgi:hypothetical protein
LRWKSTRAPRTVFNSLSRFAQHKEKTNQSQTDGSESVMLKSKVNNDTHQCVLGMPSSIIFVTLACIVQLSRRSRGRCSSCSQEGCRRPSSCRPSSCRPQTRSCAQSGFSPYHQISVLPVVDGCQYLGAGQECVCGGRSCGLLSFPPEDPHSPGRQRRYDR